MHALTKSVAVEGIKLPSLSGRVRCLTAELFKMKWSNEHIGAWTKDRPNKKKIFELLKLKRIKVDI